MPNKRETNRAEKQTVRDETVELTEKSFLRPNEPYLAPATGRMSDILRFNKHKKAKIQRENDDIFGFYAYGGRLICINSRKLKMNNSVEPAVWEKC